MIKHYLIIFVTIITIILCGILSYTYNLAYIYENSLFWDMITACTAIAGIWGIAIQISHSKNLDQSKFVFDLNKEYISDSDYQKLLHYIDNPQNTEYPKEILEIVPKYLDFFEAIYILLEKKSIEISLIDELFCYRFFSIVNNSIIQNEILASKKEYYKNIIKLHYIWSNYRRKKHTDSEIPYSDTDLSLTPWYFCVSDIHKTKKHNCTSRRL